MATYKDLRILDRTAFLEIIDEAEESWVIKHYIDSGRWDVRAYGGTTRLNGDDAQYPHLLAWSMNAAIPISGWAAGFYRESIKAEILRASGRYVAWRQMMENPDFISEVTYIAWVVDSRVIVKVSPTIVFLRNARDIGYLYCEHGWHMNLYNMVACKDEDDAVHTQDISGSPSVHYFDSYRIKPGGWVCSYDTTVNDASMAMKLIEANRNGIHIERLTPRAYDSGGVIDHLDTIEIHFPSAHRENMYVRAGSKFEMTYYFLISTAAEKDNYTWVDSVTLPYGWF